MNDVADQAGVLHKRLGGIERGTVKRVAAEEAGKVLRTLECEPAEAVIVSACIAGLAELDPYADPGDAADVEESVALAGWRLRERLRTPGEADAAHERYPAPQEVAAHRDEAREAWERLLPVSAFREMALAARMVRELHRWSAVEILCDESARAAAKDAGRARDLAVIAVRIARHLPVPEWWRLCLLAYAVAHLGNALRVASKLDAAGRTFAAARRLWEKGADPDRLLDPGRLPDLEASLRRAQRRFGEALRLLKEAAAVTRRPEHVALKAASTLAMMGEYNQAIEVLIGVAPRVERHPDRRLLTIQRFNLAVALSHVGRHREAAYSFPPSAGWPRRTTSTASGPGGSKGAYPPAWGGTAGRWRRSTRPALLRAARHALRRRAGARRNGGDPPRPRPARRGAGVDRRSGPDLRAAGRP